MANFQVKNFPDELHEALAGRAQDEGMSMSAYVTAELRGILQAPTRDEWFDELDRVLPVASLPQVDSAALIREVRQEHGRDERRLYE
jgi:plasmid stability protein